MSEESIQRLDRLLSKQVAADRTAMETIDRLLDIRLELMRTRNGASSSEAR